MTIASIKLESKVVSRLISQTRIQDIGQLQEEIKNFCDRWQIEELYLFGSVLRDDFHANSDIDVMVKFNSYARWGFEFVDIKQELEKLFGRKVDLLTKASIENSSNWIRRKEILGTTRLIYASR